MCSFKKARDVVLMAYEQSSIDDDEFVALYDVCRSKNPEFPYKEFSRFCLDEMDEAECTAEFRFHKDEIPILAQAMDIPEEFKCYQGTVCEGMEALCITLRRFAYPCRYSDLIHRFGRPTPELSMISNTVVDFIYERHAHKITQWNHDLLAPENLRAYAEAIYRKGAALDNCFGFIDGTVKAICRPGQMQRVVYNGHKRVHGLKYQAITLPTGIIANMYGPVEGRKHDASILVDSGLLDDLEQNAFSPTGEAMCLYGDPAYPLRVHLQAPYRNRELTPNMLLFNKTMSAVRVSVEWIFGDIVNYYKFLDFKKNLKIGLSSIGKMYMVVAILRNALTCLQSNSTAAFFDLEPPSIEQYFS